MTLLCVEIMKSAKIPDKHRFIIALDPSGSFYEGKGTTGYCVYDTERNTFVTCGSIYAKHYNCAEAYWSNVLNFVECEVNWFHDVVVVCEDYLLYANKLQDQINSRMETPKLIGALQLWCFQHEVPYYMQTASEVKRRWSDEILEHKGIIKRNGRGWLPTSGNTSTYTHHSLDAIRHAVHYATFRN